MLNIRHICVLQTLDTVKTVIKTGFEHVKICYSIGQYLKDLRSTVNKPLNLVSLSGRLDKIVPCISVQGSFFCGDVIVITSWAHSIVVNFSAVRPLGSIGKYFAG